MLTHDSITPSFTNMWQMPFFSKLPIRFLIWLSTELSRVRKKV